MKAKAKKVAVKKVSKGLHITLPEKTKDRAMIWCETYGLPISALIRIAIEEKLKKEGI